MKGDVVGARNNALQSLKILEEVLPSPDHPRMANAEATLADALVHSGDRDGVISAMERALSIDRNVYGNDDIQVAIDRGKLAKLFHDAGDTARASTFVDQAIAVFDRHTDSHTEHRALACVTKAQLVAKRDPTMASSLHGKAIAILGADKDGDRLSVALTLLSLAKLHTTTGSVSQAAEAYRQVISLSDADDQRLTMLKQAAETELARLR